MKPQGIWVALEEVQMQTVTNAPIARHFEAGMLSRAMAAQGRRSCGVGSVRVLEKDEELFAEGDPAVFFYRVTEGVIRTSKLLSDGRRQIDAFHFPGDVFGVEAGDEHRFSAEAATAATVIAYRRRDLDELHFDETFSREVLDAVMHALERAQRHMLLLGRKSAIEKIATFLVDMAERLDGDDAIELPMSRLDIADHLGLTIETVSRSLTELERKGIIHVPASRRTIVLRDKAALARLNG
ncbi:hypothetical protein GCM10008026_20990 [Chelatococcus composti]|nr:hypothetical protein GCM10008026_20990 [Chelatococcus composti]